MSKKLKKYPRKPKASASVESKKRFLERVKEIDRENAKIVADRRESKKLTEKIRSVKAATARV